MVRAVLTTSVSDNAASVVTKVPTAPIINARPKAQVHFFNDEKLLKPESGISTSKAIIDKTDNPKAIHKATITFGIKLRLNNTETPIPIIALTIRAVTLLQEFCLHILITLSTKLGYYLLTLYAQNKILIIYSLNVDF